MNLLISFLCFIIVAVFTTSDDLENNNTKANNDNINNVRNTKSSSNRQVSTQDKEAEGRHIAKRTLKLGSSENCEIWNDPMSLIKGNLCGGIYLLS